MYVTFATMCRLGTSSMCRFMSVTLHFRDANVFEQAKKIEFHTELARFNSYLPKNYTAIEPLCIFNIENEQGQIKERYNGLEQLSVTLDNSKK